MDLTKSIMELKGIGEKNAALFHKLNIETIEDLLYHFPKSYESLPPVISVQEAKEQQISDPAILATVKTTPVPVHVRNLSILKLQAEDAHGALLHISFFNMPYLKNTLKVGTQYIFYGAVQEKGGSLFMSHPKLYQPAEYQKLQGKLLSVYAKTKGLTNQAISKYVRQVLEKIPDMPETLPPDLLEKYQFCSVKEALNTIHFPSDTESLANARKRFSYEEFLLFLLSMKLQQAGIEHKNACPMIDTADPGRLLEQLPYELTASQKEAYTILKGEMLQGTCINRLLQGDVGSGKTIVAVLTMLLCVSNGYQAAMMAPTEVLAVQHYEMLCNMTKQYGLAFRPTLLVGSQTAKQKREIYEKIADGSLNVVIGTHAVIQDKVMFKNLALVITDEQHRFGVRQREILSGKGKGAAHTIVMSATPIPRSLAIILYGDMEVTQLRELPAKRLPIKNCVVNQSYRQTAYRFMQKEVDAGHQVYIICPMAEPGVMDELENVVDYSKTIQAFFSPQTRIAYLHGKMRPKLKNEIMTRFAAGEIDVLVSTTVIEVGINVPNATVMMVENAERFGLATLHQIRGRVGRSDLQSYCIFMESAEKKKQNERLAILNRSNDGFEIANADLKLRGPGDFMGIQQSGAFAFRFADVYQDSALLMDAAADAAKILKSNSLLLSDSHLPLKRKLESYQTHGYLHVL